MERFAPTTDAAGRADAGQWTLGPDVGEQRLGASVNDSVRVEFVASGRAIPLDGLPPILYSARGEDERWHLFLLDAPGTAPRQLTSGPQDDQSPRGSPDGARIAFLRDGRIHFMRADGSDIRAMSREIDAQPAGRIAWSPDGEKLAFADRSTWGLTVVDVDGSNLVHLSAPAPTPVPGCPDCRAFADGEPAWSPDGLQIAFSRWDDFGLQAVWILDADGSGAAQLMPRNPPAFSSAWSPVWSRDGRIAYASEPDTHYHTSVYIMARDGSGAAPVRSLPDRWDCGPSDWSANATWIITDCGSTALRLINTVIGSLSLIDVGGGRDASFLTVGPERSVH